MIIDGDKHIFECTGRECAATLGVIGLDASGEAFAGYDDPLRIKGAVWPGSEPNRDERKELANMMVARWLAYGRANE